MSDLGYTLNDEKVACLRRLTARLRGVRPTMPDDVVIVDRFFEAMDKDGVSVNKLVGIELERLAREWGMDIPPQAAFAARLLRYVVAGFDPEYGTALALRIKHLARDLEAGEIGALELVEELSSDG